jgi:hypothetical protein
VKGVVAFYRCGDIREGDGVELLVQSNTPYFDSFDVVRDVFFPSIGAWLSDYPYLKRDAFQRLSVAVYCSRQDPDRDPAGGGAW